VEALQFCICAQLYTSFISNYNLFDYFTSNLIDHLIKKTDTNIVIKFESFIRLLLIKQVTTKHMIFCIFFFEKKE
jgi:hypothetical protein